MSEEMEDRVPEVSLEGDELSAEEAASPVARAVHAETSGLRRRTYLAAAALGSAAAQLLSGGSSLVFAHTDDKSSCTAGDIEVTGGEIINEPCVAGPYAPVARFQVTNNNNASRNCITLHLGTGPAPLAGKDILLTTNVSGVPSNTGDSNIAGNGTTQTMYALLGQLSQDLPGVTCFPGSVIAFRTASNQNDPSCDGPLTKYPGGQCRRQEICIVPFAATLKCVTGCQNGTAKQNCNIKCGEDLHLLATASGFSGQAGSNGNYKWELLGPNGQVLQTVASGTSPQCFTVQDPAAGTNQTYTIKVTDKSGVCFRTAAVTLDVQNIDVPALIKSNGPDCAGNTSLSVSNCDTTLAYIWKDNNVVINGASGCTLTRQFGVGSHNIVVTAQTADGGCTADSVAVPFTVNPPVTLTLDPFVQTNCSGSGSFTAQAGGGSGGGYVFTWKVNGQTQAGVTGATLNLAAQSDGACRTVAVSVVDGAGCPAASPASRSISQCVVTTSPCAVS